jgi:hypothetical protein
MMVSGVSVSFRGSRSGMKATEDGLASVVIALPHAGAINLVGSIRITYNFSAIKF